MWACGRSENQYRAKLVGSTRARSCDQSEVGRLHVHAHVQFDRLRCDSTEYPMGVDRGTWEGGRGATVFGRTALAGCHLHT